MNLLLCTHPDKIAANYGLQGDAEFYAYMVGLTQAVNAMKDAGVGWDFIHTALVQFLQTQQDAMPRPETARQSGQSGQSGQSRWASPRRG